MKKIKEKKIIIREIDKGKYEIGGFHQGLVIGMLMPRLWTEKSIKN